MDFPKAPPSDSGGGGSELEDCMSDLGEALADKDWEAAAMAFRRGHELCGGYDDDEDSTVEE